MREERLRAFNEAMASFAKELQDRLSFLRLRRATWKDDG